MEQLNLTTANTFWHLAEAKDEGLFQHRCYAFKLSIFFCPEYRNLPAPTYVNSTNIPGSEGNNTDVSQQVCNQLGAWGRHISSPPWSQHSEERVSKSRAAAPTELQLTSCRIYRFAWITTDFGVHIKINRRFWKSSDPIRHPVTYASLPYYSQFSVEISQKFAIKQGASS